MPKELQPIERTIISPTANLSAGAGGDILARATQDLSNLVTRRLTDLAIDEAAKQGEQDVLKGKTPPTLALPFTPATQAYNNAVTQAESRQLVMTAENLINESLAKHSDPAKFNHNTPAVFNAELEGIKQGILDNARDQTKPHINAVLDHMSNKAREKMLGQSIDFDNKQTMAQFNNELAKMLSSRRDAAISGDKELISAIDQNIKESLSNYSVINQQIKNQLPEIEQELEQRKSVDNALARYTDAIETKTTDKFMSDLASNKDNLPYDLWEKTTQAVIKLDRNHRELNNQINAAEYAQASLGIQTGTVNSREDILKFNNLTTPQVFNLETILDKKKAKEIKAQNKIIEFQQNILSGRPTFNSGASRDEMFKKAVALQEGDTQQPATLVDMENIIMGTSKFPASGMPNMPLGADVPAFNSVLTNYLTSKDPIKVQQAAMVYNDMTKIRTQGESSVSISGEALSVASLFSILNQGAIDPVSAANRAIDTVLNVSEPEIQERADRYNRTLANINPATKRSPLHDKFKEVYGVEPQAFDSDEAFKVFKDTFRAHYLASSSEQAALDATKYSMRQWGTSKYFAQGVVGQPVPEKELPITQMGHSFGNQIYYNLQAFINRNEKLRKENPDLNLPEIKWAPGSSSLPLNVSDFDRVTNNYANAPLMGGEAGIKDPEALRLMRRDYIKPRISIDGQETDVVLMSAPSSRLGNSIHYIYGIYDRFNNLTPLVDSTNDVNGLATFVPQPLAVWAPEVVKDENNKMLREVAEKVVTKKDMDEAERIRSQFFPFSPNRYIETYKYLKEKAKTKDEEINKVFEQLKEVKAPEPEQLNKVIRAGVSKADNIGIADQ